MKPLNLEELTRRAFLIRSAVALGGVAPLVKVFPATALGALQGRPPLSEASLGSYIQTARSQGTLAVNGLVTEVRSDLRAFLRKRFALSPVQEAFVSGLTTTDLTNIGTAFERGLTGRNELRIQMPEPGLAKGKCAMTVNRGEGPRVAGATTETWSVVVMRP